MSVPGEDKVGDALAVSGDPAALAGPPARLDRESLRWGKCYGIPSPGKGARIGANRGNM